MLAAAFAQNDAVVAVEEVACLQSAFEALDGNRLTLLAVPGLGDHRNPGVVEEGGGGAGRVRVWLPAKVR